MKDNGSCVRIVDGYLFDFSKLVEHARRYGYRRLLLEAPPGMLRISEKLSSIIAECLGGDIEVIVRLEPVYGSCATSLHLLDQGFVDAIVHVGHDEYPYPLSTGSRCLYSSPSSLFTLKASILLLMLTALHRE